MYMLHTASVFQFGPAWTDTTAEILDFEWIISVY